MKKLIQEAIGTPDHELLPRFLPTVKKKSNGDAGSINITIPGHTFCEQ